MSYSKLLLAFLILLIFSSCYTSSIEYRSNGRKFAKREIAKLKRTDIRSGGKIPRKRKTTFYHYENGEIVYQVKYIYKFSNPTDSTGASYLHNIKIKDPHNLDEEGKMDKYTKNSAYALSGNYVHPSTLDSVSRREYYSDSVYQRRIYFGSRRYPTLDFEDNQVVIYNGHTGGNESPSISYKSKHGYKTNGDTLSMFYYFRTEIEPTRIVETQYLLSADRYSIFNMDGELIYVHKK